MYTPTISVAELRELFTLVHHWCWPSYCRWMNFLPGGPYRSTWRKLRASTVNVWEQSTAVWRRSGAVRTNWGPRGPNCPGWLLLFRASESWTPNKKRSLRLRRSWKVRLLCCHNTRTRNSLNEGIWWNISNSSLHMDYPRLRPLKWKVCTPVLNERFCLKAWLETLSTHLIYIISSP